jgi:DNA-binding CsgD family transcriptional regulator
MSLSLSSAEVQQLSRAIQLLVSPLDHESVDAWRSAVNRELSALLHADSAGFLMPVEEGLYLYSDEHDPDELARYPDYPPPPRRNGEEMWAAMTRKPVMTLAEWYGEDYHLYTNSTYYNEYSGANGAHDTLWAAWGMGRGDPREMACLHFWHERPDGRLFGEREVALLELLHPAFAAGVETQIRWGQHRRDLLDAIDHLEKPAMVADLAGRVVHVSPGMEALLQGDPEEQRLRGELMAIVHDMRRVPTGEGTPALDGEGAVGREVVTATARYRACGCLYGRDLHGRPAFVIAGLERCTPALRPAAELQEAFGLTPAEARVALLLGEGRSNRSVAAELCVTEHTARRHTERIFAKMRINSRAQIAPLLFV